MDHVIWEAYSTLQEVQIPRQNLAIQPVPNSTRTRLTFGPGAMSDAGDRMSCRRKRSR
jgi:hypothetical protein